MGLYFHYTDLARWTSLQIDRYWRRQQGRKMMIPHPHFHRRMHRGKCPSHRRWRLCCICRRRRGNELDFVFVSVPLLFPSYFLGGRGGEGIEKRWGERTIDLKPRTRIPHDALARPSQCFFASLLCTSAVDFCRAGPDVNMCKAQFLVLALRNYRWFSRSTKGIKIGKTKEERERGIKGERLPHCPQ